MLPTESGKDCTDLPHKLNNTAVWKEDFTVHTKKKMNAICVSKFHVSRESISVF